MHKYIQFYTVTLSLILFFSFTAFANTEHIEAPKEIAKRVQSKIDTIESLSFKFYQQTRGEMTGRPRKGSGNALFYKKNGKSLMRWNYNSPDKQVLVSDGEIFSMYFSSQNQMIITSAKNLDSDLTYSFFTGKSKLESNFHILAQDEEFGEDIQGFKIIKLVPKTPHSQVQDIHIWITETSLIRRMHIRDHFGTITVLNLSDIVVNDLAGADDKAVQALFSFTAPEGTELIEQ